MSRKVPLKKRVAPKRTSKKRLIEIAAKTHDQAGSKVSGRPLVSDGRPLVLGGRQVVLDGVTIRLAGVSGTPKYHTEKEIREAVRDYVKAQKRA
ncbi:MAG TPA: hypothetical protein DCL54_08655 [Alphaproteobacteria bacterium]|nr:hypothetical protein [Alphaproteobacteria bacterium]